MPVKPAYRHGQGGVGGPIRYFQKNEMRPQTRSRIRIGDCEKQNSTGGKLRVSEVRGRSTSEREILQQMPSAQASFLTRSGNAQVYCSDRGIAARLVRRVSCHKYRKSEESLEKTLAGHFLTCDQMLR